MTTAIPTERITPPALPAAASLRITVLGAGTMGHGLALLAAVSGHRVRLVDVAPEALAKALKLIRAQLAWLQEEDALFGRPVREIFERIEPLQNLEPAVASCDLILEAVSEDEPIKAELFAKLAPLVPAQCVIASNTSYLNVFSLAPAALLPRLAIAHFYAPPYLIPLVEVVGGQSGPAVVSWLVTVLRQMGQRPVVLERFVPGFIVNRLQRAMAREIFYLLDNGYAGADAIDTAVQASLGLRLPVLGVVRRYDFTGLDISLKFLSNPSIHLINDDPIPRSLKEKVDVGDLGVKSGRGFFRYEGLPTEDVLRERDHRLLALRRFTAREKIALTDPGSAKETT